MKFRYLLVSLLLAVFLSTTGLAARKGAGLITVTTEGVGTTKEDATKKAWLEAVRQAVGVVVDDVSQVDNDKLSEKLITHSKGTVKAYDVIKAEKRNRRWYVTIRAKVEREVLKRAARESTITRDISDSRHLAAEIHTDKEQKLTGTELLEAVLKRYTPGQFVSFQADGIFKSDNQMGLGAPSLSFSKKYDLNFYFKDFIPTLTKTMKQVAEASQSISFAGHYDNQVIASKYFSNTLDPIYQKASQLTVVASNVSQSLIANQLGGKVPQGYFIVTVMDTKNSCTCYVLPKVMQPVMDRFYKRFIAVACLTFNFKDAGGRVLAQKELTLPQQVMNRDSFSTIYRDATNDYFWGVRYFIVPQDYLHAERSPTLFDTKGNYLSFKMNGISNGTLAQIKSVSVKTDMMREDQF